VVDPISNLISNGSTMEVKGMLTRLIDYLKQQEITGLFTSLTFGDSPLESTEVGISSLMDSWILLRSVEHNGERNRALYVLKSRATAHSNQVREFVLSQKGIELIDVYTGGGTVLTGTARVAQAAREKAERVLREQTLERRKRELDREREAVEAQIKLLQTGLEARVDELAHEIREDALLEATADSDRERIRTVRDGRRNGELTKAKKSKNPK
jgi:circadian clock protein KaiC